MSERAVTQAQPAKTPTAKPASVLQRKCACGTHTIAGGECEECGKQGLAGESRAADGFDSFSMPRETPTQPPARARGAQGQSSFVHDFSRVRTQTQAPDASVHPAAAVATSAGQKERGRSSGNLFLKARAGSAPATSADPRALQAQLDSGRSLDGRVRTRMESAFGQDLSHVRVHANSTAAALSAGLNARAFTVGQDVAFGAGEYQPNTLFGDALIAHELAHVIQQGGAHAAVAPLEKGGQPQEALEQEADRSAVSVVTSLWGAAKGAMREIAQNAMPRLRSGLRLARCSGCGRGGCDKAPPESDKDAGAADAAPDAAPAPSDAGAPDAAADTPPPPGCIMGKAATLSTAGIQFIKDWELWRDTPYDDLPNNAAKTSCTVGWGHKMHRGLCTAEEKAKKMTQAEGDKILAEDYQWALDTVHDKFPEICVPQNQIDAIVSLIFNSGRANIIGKSPTNPMHRFSRILRGKESPKEKARLVAIEIRASRGDKNRRKKEANMFENRDYDSKH